MMEMRVDGRGEGPPVVLVGGGLTGWASWVPHQERLAARRRALRAQPLNVQLGLDDAAVPPDYSIDGEADALGAALDREGVDVLDVVAWSHGAACALDFALDHPERVRTLTLVEPPAFWVLSATGWLDAESQADSDRLRNLLSGITTDVDEPQLVSFLEAVALVPPGARAQELAGWPLWYAHRRSLRIGDAAWRHTDTVERLRAFDRPTLLVKGIGTAHFLRRVIDALAATLPRAELLELPGGHAPQIVAVEPFLERLTAFLDEPR